MSEPSAEAEAPTDLQSTQKPRRPTRSLPAAPLEVALDPPPETDSESAYHDPDGNVLVESPTHEEHDQIATALTPLRAHYLKKTLVTLQFGRELDAITTASPQPNVSTLSYLGPPFTSPPKGVQPLDLPFLKYIFRQFVLTFPFLAAAPKDFFPEKLQPFIASALSRNLSPTSVVDDNPENSEEATRLKLLAKLEKQFGLILGSATKLVEREEVVRLTQADLSRLETLARKRRAREQRIKDVFEVNVVCVRTVVDKGRVRSKVHEEFIVRTRRSHQPDVFVSRRYGDFKTLADELRKKHPEELVRPPPAKDRTTVTASHTSPSSLRTSSGSLATQYNDSSDSLSSQQGSSFRLAREKNRLTLRAYLHSLLSSSTLASSPVLRSFLLSGPTHLSPEEDEDARRREEADERREEGRKRFAREIAGRVEGLRSAVRNVKGDIMAKDGLRRIFATIKVTEDVRDLPPEYQAVLEWARTSLASTVFHHFVAADDASGSLAALKRLHGLVPYFLLKGVLRISNPVAMIRGVMDLFLAQPFGGRSLLQRMFSSSLQEEVKALEEDIEAVKDKVEDPIMCEKVRQFVNAPREIQGIYRADAVAENLNVLTVVLRSPDEPALSRFQMLRVSRAYRAHVAYLKARNDLADSDDDDGPQDDDAWLFEDLSILAKLYSRLRDKEQLIALIFEGNTSDLLKDIITIFYSPLAQVYKAASIADSLGDLQSFIDDLIRTVEQSEEGQEDSHRVVQAFMDLIQRHEQAFYSFVHKVHSKGEGLFDSLMRWIELFLTAVREGLGEKISLEFVLPHTGKERTDIIKEVDEVALYHYKLKLAYEDKIRRRFGKAQANHDADAEDEATQLLVNGVVHDLSFGELVKGDAEDIAAEESDESGESSSDETGSEDESESEEESSNEDNSKPEAVPAVARSRTVGHAAVPSRSDRGRQQAVNGEFAHTPPSRSRSVNAAQSSNSPKDTNDIPPVPPLKRHSQYSLSKPLPPNPSPLRRSFDVSLSKPLPPDPLAARPSQEDRSTEPRRPQPTVISAPKRNKKPAAILKPPDLKHVPELLPLFVEMMKPLLIPRGI